MTLDATLTMISIALLLVMLCPASLVWCTGLTNGREENLRPTNRITRGDTEHESFPMLLSDTSSGEQARPGKHHSSGDSLRDRVNTFILPPVSHATPSKSATGNSRPGKYTAKISSSEPSREDEDFREYIEKILSRGNDEFEPKGESSKGPTSSCEVDETKAGEWDNEESDESDDGGDCSGPRSHWHSSYEKVDGRTKFKPFIHDKVTSNAVPSDFVDTLALKKPPEQRLNSGAPSEEGATRSEGQSEDCFDNLDSEDLVSPRPPGFLPDERRNSAP
jgi:hypothetical protein